MRPDADYTNTRLLYLVSQAHQCSYEDPCAVVAPANRVMRGAYAMSNPILHFKLIHVFHLMGVFKNAIGYESGSVPCVVAWRRLYGHWSLVMVRKVSLDRIGFLSADCINRLSSSAGTSESITLHVASTRNAKVARKPLQLLSDVHWSPCLVIGS